MDDVHVAKKERRIIIIIIIIIIIKRNGAKTISLQTLFGRLKNSNEIIKRKIQIIFLLEIADMTGEIQVYTGTEYYTI